MFYSVIGVLILCGCWQNDHSRLQTALAMSAVTFNGLPVNEEFNFAWNRPDSPDGLWQRSSWVATGNNLFTWDNAVVQPLYAGATDGVLILTVRADQSSDGHYQGGELQSIGDSGSNFGYGYYEVRMKTTSEPGCCVSFFWIQAPGYGPEEIDIEFLTNEPWTETSGTVHYTIHPGWDTYQTYKTQTLAFNPSRDFHRYGFLWTPDAISYTVDGQVVQTYSRPACRNIPRNKGYIMMNAWTGNANWGGGPPANDAASVYDWVKFYPGVTSVPVE
jgi:beta-glucanase (GH16 family)